MNSQNSGLKSYRPLAWALYALAAMFVIVPLNEMGARLGWQATPGALNWRTGAVGLFSSGLLTPASGLVIALVTAFIFEHRWVQRVMMGLSGLTALALFVLLAAFALDALQLRGAINPAMQRAYLVAVAKAMLNIAVVATTLGIACLASFLAGRKSAREHAAKRRGETADTPVVMGLSR